MTGARIRSPARSQPSRARATNRDALQYTVSASARSAAELHTRSGDRALPSCPAPPVLTTARSPAVRRRRPTLGSTASTTGVAAEVGSWRSVVVTGLTRDGLATAEFGIAVGRAHVGRAAAEHTVACRGPRRHGPSAMPHRAARARCGCRQTHDQGCRKCHLLLLRTGAGARECEWHRKEPSQGLAAPQGPPHVCISSANTGANTAF